MCSRYVADPERCENCKNDFCEEHFADCGLCVRCTLIEELENADMDTVMEYYQQWIKYLRIK